MWEVSDADSHIWLFGSIHVLPPGVPWRTPAFDDALHQAEQVYFEADVGPLGQVAIVLKSISMGMSGPKPWLPELTPEQTAKLTAAISPLGLTTQQLSAFPAWLAEATIEDKVMKSLGFDIALGVDPSLQAELPKERKSYFETAAGQMDMLADEPIDVQIKRLMATVDNIDKLPAQIGELATTWEAGNTDALGTQILDDPSIDKAFLKRMVLDRNANWVTTIEQLMAGNHQDLIVVGAGHLTGAGSVVDLLGKAGFTVQRIQ